MSKKRTNYTSVFKTKLVLELLQNESTLAEIASKHSILPQSLVNQKKTFLANAEIAMEPSKAVKEYKEELIKSQEQNERLTALVGKVTTEEEALLALDEFEYRWDGQFPNIAKSWRRHWDNVATLFVYPEDIRRAIYTINAIESLNSMIRKSIRSRKIFNHDDSAFKIVFLAIEAASKKWTMPIRNWPQAMNQFIILHEDRLKYYASIRNRDVCTF